VSDSKASVFADTARRLVLRSDGLFDGSTPSSTVAGAILMVAAAGWAIAAELAAAREAHRTVVGPDKQPGVQL
jgi:hypothetical protein